MNIKNTEEYKKIYDELMEVYPNDSVRGMQAMKKYYKLHPDIKPKT